MDENEKKCSRYNRLLKFHTAIELFIKVPRRFDYIFGLRNSNLTDRTGLFAGRGRRFVLFIKRPTIGWMINYTIHIEIPERLQYEIYYYWHSYNDRQMFTKESLRDIIYFLRFPRVHTLPPADFNNSFYGANNSIIRFWCKPIKTLRKIICLNASIPYTIKCERYYKRFVLLR